MSVRLWTRKGRQAVVRYCNVPFQHFHYRNEKSDGNPQDKSLDRYSNLGPPENEHRDPRCVFRSRTYSSTSWRWLSSGMLHRVVWYWPAFQRCLLLPSSERWELVALMANAVSTLETSVNIYQSTWRSIPEDSHLHTRRREDLKSHLAVLHV
jgi:hypothetical protein